MDDAEEDIGDKDGTSPLAANEVVHFSGEKCKEAGRTPVMPLNRDVRSQIFGRGR
jgi:hypothetical protein